MAREAACKAAFQVLDERLPDDGWNLASVARGSEAGRSAESRPAVLRDLASMAAEAFALTDRKIIHPKHDSDPSRAWAASEAAQLVRCKPVFKVEHLRSSTLPNEGAPAYIPALHSSSRSWRGMVRGNTPLPAYLALAAHRRIVALAIQDQLARDSAIVAALDAWMTTFASWNRIVSKAGSVRSISTATESVASPGVASNLSRAGTEVISVASAAGRSRTARLGSSSLARFSSSAGSGSAEPSMTISMGEASADFAADACAGEAIEAARADVRAMLSCFSPVRLGDALTLEAGGDPTLPALFRSSSSARRFRSALAGRRAEQATPLDDSAPARGRSHVTAIRGGKPPAIPRDDDAVSLLQLLRWWTPDLHMEDLHSAVCALMYDAQDFAPVPASILPRPSAGPASLPPAPPGSVTVPDTLCELVGDTRTSRGSVSAPVSPGRAASLPPVWGGAAPSPGVLRATSASLSSPIVRSSALGRAAAAGFAPMLSVSSSVASEAPSRSPSRCSSLGDREGPPPPAAIASTFVPSARRRRPVGPRRFAIKGLERILATLAERHPDLAPVASSELRLGRYCAYVSAFCAGALRGHTATFVTERDLQQSNLVEALAACATHSLEKLMPFAPRVFAACSDRFDGLVARLRRHAGAGAVRPCKGSRTGEVCIDVESLIRARDDGALGATPAADGPAPEGESCLGVTRVASWALRRVASGAVRPVASGHKGFLSFEDFAWLSIAEEDRMAGASITYWCRVLDVDDDGRVGAMDVAAAVRDRHGAGAAVDLEGEGALPRSARGSVTGSAPLQQESAAILLRDCFGVGPEDEGGFSFTAARVRSKRCGGVVYRMLLEQP